MDYRINNLQCNDENIVIERKVEDFAQKLMDDAARSAINVKLVSNYGTPGTSLASGYIQIGFGSA